MTTPDLPSRNWIANINGASSKEKEKDMLNNNTKSNTDNDSVNKKYLFKLTFKKFNRIKHNYESHMYHYVILFNMIDKICSTL